MRNPFRKDKTPEIERKNRAMLLGMGKYSGMGSSFDALATEGYAQNAIANACINKIANAIASVDLDVYVKDQNGNMVEKENHPLYDLIEKPNNRQSRRVLMRDLVTQYLIGGNAFVLGANVANDMTKPPTSLYLLSPAKVKMIQGQTAPTAYQYKPSPANIYTYPIDPITERSQVMHIKTTNPLSEWEGLAPMLAAAYGIDIFNSGMRWNKKLLDNDCRPAGALMVEDGGKSTPLSDEQYLRLKEEIEQQFSGAGNAGKPLLLEGGLVWKELSISPKDMDYKENILMAARFIAGVFHVPPQLVNIPGESTYSNYEQAEMSFWADTVLPLLCSIIDDFNRWLSPLYKDGAFLWYDEDSITALEPLRKIKFERMNAATFISTNEKRYSTGFEKADGGDEILVDSGKIPISLLEASMNEPSN